MQKIYAPFVSPETDLNHDVWLNAETSLRIVERCDQSGIAVIGMDGGTLKGEVFTPDIKLILDVSSIRASQRWREYREIGNIAAKGFLSKYLDRPELVFSLVLMCEDEFNSSN